MPEKNRSAEELPAVAAIYANKKSLTNATLEVQTCFFLLGSHVYLKIKGNE